MEFTFFERVSAGPGTTGTVLGISVHEETGEKSYAVLIDGGLTEMFAASDLTSLGVIVPRSEIYDGTSIRVSPEGEVLPPP